ncbi:MAG: kinase [Candidatus Curtissbacteria bacterium]|nr:kinase [Candidatus Curtissbacteria bacterium]
MVISRTPFRISFFGGGTDYPAWYEKNGGGAVIAASINKYCYVTCRHLPPFFKYNYRIRYTKQEHKRNISQINHPSVRECLKFVGHESGLEMQHNADLPAMSGLGSSSSFTVGFLNSLYGLEGKMVDKLQLAQDAIYVEQKLIKENVGSQDQTIAAFGGLNRIEFSAGPTIKVTPIMMNQGRQNLLLDHLMLFFTGFSRNASDVAKSQIKATSKKKRELKKMLRLVDDAQKILVSTKAPIEDFGRLLDESWAIKRSLTTKISNKVIDDLYLSAKEAGALGGKLLGAGGGGFMLLFVKPEEQEKVRAKLKRLLFVPFKFESNGSQIIYKMPNDF